MVLLPAHTHLLLPLALVLLARDRNVAVEQRQQGPECLFRAFGLVVALGFAQASGLQIPADFADELHRLHLTSVRGYVTWAISIGC